MWKSLKLYFETFKSFVFFIAGFLIMPMTLNAQITFNYGDLNDEILSYSYCPVATIGEMTAIVTYIENQSSQLHFIDNSAEIIQTIDLQNNTAVFAPDLYADEEHFVLMGYESPVQISLDSATLANRLWKIQFYDVNGNLVRERTTKVLSNEIGFTAQSTINGISADVVHYQPSSTFGTIDQGTCIHIMQGTNVSPIDQTVSPGISVLSYYSFEQDQLVRIPVEGNIGNFSSAYGFQNALYFTAIKVANGDVESLVHQFNVEDSSIISSNVENIYNTIRLPLYRKANGESLYSAKSTVKGALNQNMGDLVLSKFDKELNLLVSSTIIEDAAPFGPYSLNIGNEHELYLVSVDVINRNPLQLKLHKVNKEDLAEVWAVDLPFEDFGQYEALTILEDGSVLIFGNQPVSSNLSRLKVTKIGPDGTVTSAKNYSAREFSWRVENPVRGGNINFYLPTLFNADQKIYFQIISLDGQVIAQQQLNQNNYSFDLLNGLYLVKLIDKVNNQSFGTQKIIVKN